MEKGVQRALRARLEDVDQEIADLRSLLVFIRRIDRDEALRERLRQADLGFRMQDLWAGRITGERLRRALQTLEGLMGATARV